LNQRSGFASVLWSSCLAMLAVGANSTAIMAALPSMRTELVLSSAGVEWAINAYLVVSAAFIVLGGQAADRFGARLASMAGLALFGVASCIIAAAGTQAALLAGRALQGLAAALAVPSTLAAVDASATPQRRHRTAARRRAHSPHGLAGDLLVQRRAHAGRDCRPRLRRLGPCFR
jgi:MFS family permease